MKKNKSTLTSTPKSIPSQQNLRVTNLRAGIILAIFGFLLYCNTLNHQYVMDDYAAITGNKVTQLGVKGIPTILQTSYWYGMDGKNHSIYRPLSLVMFAIEWQISPDNPFISHLINVLLYSLTAFVLYYFVRRLFPKQNIWFAFIISLLWLVHPLHTEVVANIKSRDEILCFLFSILALSEGLKTINSNNLKNSILMSFYFILALLSKETAISIAAILPLTIYLSNSIPLKKTFKTLIPIVACAVIFLIVRNIVLNDEVNNVIPIYDNSMAGASFNERYGTAIFILGYYLVKFLFPFSFASDYSFNQIPLTDFSNPLVLLTVIVYIGMIGYSIRNFRNRIPIVYGILFFMLSIVIVSNLFFLIGSTMADRFMYMPSLGLAIVFTSLLFRIFRVQTEQISGFKNRISMSIRSKILLVITLSVAFYCSAKTIERNNDWKDNLTLFSSDLKSAPHNVKMRFYYARSVMEKLKDPEMDVAEKKDYLQNVFIELNGALKIDSQYYLLYNSLAEAYNWEKKYPEAISNYKKSISLKNLATTNLNLGNVYFRTMHYDSAVHYLSITVKLDSTSFNGFNSLAGAYFGLNNYNEALKYYKKAIELNIEYAEAYKNIGTTYSAMKKYDDAISFYNKFIEMKPDDATGYKYLGLVYRYKGDSSKANFYESKAKAIDPSLK